MSAKLKEVLAQPALEPVAVVVVNQSGGIRMEYQDGSAFDISKHVGQRFYTTPPQPEQKLKVVDGVIYTLEWVRQDFQPAQQKQEPVGDKLDKLLWEYVDLQAAHPEHKPSPKTWSHLMAYAPQPAQEPVAWMHVQGDYEEPSWRQLDDDEIEMGWKQYPLYTTPPQRTWVELTDDDIKILWKATPQLVGVYSYTDIAKEVEATLRSKNT